MRSKKLITLILLILVCTAEAQTLKAVRAWLLQDPKTRSPFDLQASKALSKKDAAEIGSLLLQSLQDEAAANMSAEWKNKELRLGTRVMKFDYKVFGNKPAAGRSLFISMHGGGNTSAATNDQQWRNQIRLYTPAEGVYLAPRAPTNTWNLWHEPHIDSLFDKLILAAVMFEGVNPDKVYLMGYSAGGDGVYQLAPRMADRWAAAAMMAGHPNETSPLGLRNIGFAIHVGALDNGFKRNDVARQWARLLDSLQKQDPEGYRHAVQIHEGRPHWMNRQDTVAVPWMAAFTRNTVPSKVVWKQDDMVHEQFYWLAVPSKNIKVGGEIIAEYNNNEIRVLKNYSDTLIIRLNDTMVDLDKPVRISYLEKNIFNGKLKRQTSVIYKTAAERKDRALMFPVEVAVVNGKLIEGLE